MEGWLKPKVSYRAVGEGPRLNVIHLNRNTYQGRCSKRRARSGDLNACQQKIKRKRKEVFSGIRLTKGGPKS
jgi:hypothetical protein